MTQLTEFRVLLDVTLLMRAKIEAENRGGTLVHSR